MTILITSPVARLIGGSLYEGRKTDNDGKPYAFKNGARAGQPYEQHSFGIAVPKEPGHTHWNQTGWGKQIWEEGRVGSPNSHALPSFSWKIQDGDSQTPNKKGNKPADQEGYPGNWILWFQANENPAPIFNADGSAPLTTPGAVKPGYWVQVRFEADFNKRTDSPGMYLQQKMVAYSAPGTEIILRVQESPADAGFGQAPLPAGVSATPAPALGGTAPAAPGAAPAPTPTPTSVTPAPNFLAPAPAGPQPTAKAWTTLEGMLAADGWTLDLLIAQGYVTPAPAAAPAPSAPAPTPAPTPTPAPAPAGPQPTAKAWTTLEGMLAADGWTLDLLIAQGYVTA